MDSSHKATCSNYPSVFTALPRVAMFKIHPVLLSTEQAGFRSGAWGGGLGKRQRYCLWIAAGKEIHLWLVRKVKRFVARGRGRGLDLQARRGFNLRLPQSSCMRSGRWFNIHMPRFLAVRSSQSFQPTRNCLTRSLCDGKHRLVKMEAPLYHFWQHIPQWQLDFLVRATLKGQTAYVQGTKLASQHAWFRASIWI